jgi:hypothetical protein
MLHLSLFQWNNGLHERVSMSHCMYISLPPINCKEDTESLSICYCSMYICYCSMYIFITVMFQFVTKSMITHRTCPNWLLCGKVPISVYGWENRPASCLATAAWATPPLWSITGGENLKGSCISTHPYTIQYPQVYWLYHFSINKTVVICTL